MIKHSLRAARATAAALAMSGAAAAWSTASAATNIQEVVSPGGITAWLVEERAIPIISIEISFRGGARLDADDKAGLATFFTSMLDEGAGDLDTRAFAQRRDELAARVSFSASRDAVSVSITTLADRRDESLELARLALLEPRFDAEPLERVRAQIISRIRQQAVSPDAIASLRLMDVAFPDDPYGVSRLGVEETVATITAEDLRAAHGALLNRSAINVAVVGAISAEELGPILDRLLGGLPASEPPALEPIAPKLESGVDVVDFDAPQSTVVFGHAGILRDDPDYIPAFVMNYILGGGGFASRLMEEIRERRGLAYGVYSYLSPLDRAGLYLGGVSTTNERVAESIQLIRAEWARMAAGEIDDSDLERAKQYLTGSYALRFDSNAKIARILLAVQRDNLGIDYIANRNALVEAVTLDDLRRVAARLLRSDELYFVVVGRPDGLDDARIVEQ